VDIEVYLKIFVLPPGHANWNWRLPRYDPKWGAQRTNVEERLAAIAHEMDHWKTWTVGYFPRVRAQVDSVYDGKWYKTHGDCKRVAHCLRNAVIWYFEAAHAHSSTFDAERWNGGGEYKNHRLPDYLGTYLPCQ